MRSTKKSCFCALKAASAFSRSETRDQSSYGFNGSNPALLEGLSKRPTSGASWLRFNYRSGAKIIRASLGALGEDRDYRGLDDVPEGELTFWKVRGDLDLQAAAIAATVLPNLLARHSPEEVAILYRAAWLGDKVAGARRQEIPISAPTITLWSSGIRLLRASWRGAPSGRLAARAKPTRPSRACFAKRWCSVYGRWARVAQEQALSLQLIAFLRSSIDLGETAHVWLTRLYRDLVQPWRAMSRNPQQDWDACLDLVAKTNPAKGKDMPLSTFAGRVEGSGRLNLCSTFHSAKGREFDAVILFGMNSGDIPSKRDRASAASLREVRRLFYVGVTPPPVDCLPGWKPLALGNRIV